MSINMGPLKEGKLNCELNDATDENEYAPALKYKASYTYLAIEVLDRNNNSCLLNSELANHKIALSTVMISYDVLITFKSTEY